MEMLGIQRREVLTRELNSILASTSNWGGLVLWHRPVPLLVYFGVHWFPSYVKEA
jgi:hypothetical protein